MPELLRFPVGATEQHWVQVYYEKMFGGFRITVDGVAVVEETQVFGASTVRRWPILVGVNEVHEVVVEKERPVLFALFRPTTVRGYVDGVLVASTPQ